jgi:ribonucleoside-diphosphate reductase alpha chain
MDSLTLAISQGSLRRGSAACYLDIFHPEIEEFLEIRKAAGDFNRKSLNLHHGINITDEFMEAVRQDAPFQLKSPKTGEVMKEVSARKLWQKLLELRMADGRALPAVHRHREQRDAGAPETAGLQGSPVEPVLGDHAPHRPRP